MNWCSVVDIPANLATCSGSNQTEDYGHSCIDFCDENNEKCRREMAIKGFLLNTVALGDLPKWSEK
jgi:hypothetical protein